MFELKPGSRRQVNNLKIVAVDLYRTGLISCVRIKTPDGRVLEEFKSYQKNLVGFPVWDGAGDWNKAVEYAQNVKDFVKKK